MKQSYLKSVLSYDKQSGIFIWKMSKGKRVKAGYVAGKWAYGKTDKVFNEYLNDPASIDSALADAVEG